MNSCTMARLIGVEEVAKKLGMSVGWVRKYQGKAIPHPTLFYGRNLWREEEIDGLIEQIRPLPGQLQDGP